MMKRIAEWRRITLLAVLSLAGCVVAPPSGERAAAPLPQQESPPVQALPAPQGNPAVLALLNSADAREQAGQYEQAAATLERALRLEPRNAMLWYRLARVRLSEGRWKIAVDFAAKSNSLAGGNSDLRARNWAVIAAAKDGLGDRKGAAAARARMNAGAEDR